VIKYKSGSFSLWVKVLKRLSKRFFFYHSTFGADECYFRDSVEINVWSAVEEISFLLGAASMHSVPLKYSEDCLTIIVCDSHSGWGNQEGFLDALLQFI